MLGSRYQKYRSKAFPAEFSQECRQDFTSGDVCRRERDEARRFRVGSRYGRVHSYRDEERAMKFAGVLAVTISVVCFGCGGNGASGAAAGTETPAAAATQAEAASAAAPPAAEKPAEPPAPA